MKNNKLHIPRHSSIDHRSSIVLNSNFETVNHSARKTFDPTSESAAQNYLSATNIQPKKPENSGSVLARLQGPVQNGTTPKNMFLINRRLTKGYLKFLEDKDFIDRREGERQKIEEDVKKALSTDNSKVMSKDIQKLISSTILNDPTKRTRSVLKVVDNNCSSGNLNSVDDIHKQLCNRIMGGDFENNLLFVKVQEGTLQNTQHLRERSAPNDSSKSKISSLTSLRKQAELVSPMKVKRIHRKSLANSMAWSLNNLSDKKRDGEKLVSNTLVEKAKSLNQFGPSSIQVIDAATSLNELEFSQHASSRRCEGEPVKTAESKTSLGKKLVFEGNEGNFKVRMNVKRKSNQSEYFSAAVIQSKGQKSAPVLKKSAPNSVFVTGNEILASRTNVDSSVNSKVLDNQEKDSITNINKLCSGIIRSTNKLGAKLKRQQRKIGKEFRRLDTQMERLHYDNTIKNWEKSVKQVENIGQKSSFFNLVL